MLSTFYLFLSMQREQKRKISLVWATLMIMGELGVVTLNAFFPAQYSFSRLWRPLLGLDRAKKLKRKTISTTLWRLKQQGLVTCVGLNKKASWRLTPTGRQYVEDQTSEIKRERKSDGITRLVVFDIPEQERKKRDIIRSELIGCGFRSLQKSVWIGEYPLTKDFIVLIDKLDLEGKVHIFSIRERGTLNEK